MQLLKLGLTTSVFIACVPTVVYVITHLSTVYTPAKQSNYCSTSEQLTLVLPMIGALVLAGGAKCRGKFVTEAMTIFI